MASRELILTDSVEGVNVLEPGSAPRVIKTWDERLSESQIESGVDDEVGPGLVLLHDKIYVACHVACCTLRPTCYMLTTTS